MEMKEKKLGKKMKTTLTGEIRGLKSDLMHGICVLSKKVKPGKSKYHSCMYTWKKLAEYQATSTNILVRLTKNLMTIKKVWK
jgi:hypothetical protein